VWHPAIVLQEFQQLQIDFIHAHITYHEHISDDFLILSEKYKQVKG
jgi:hypothetical protein